MDAGLIYQAGDFLKALHEWESAPETPPIDVAAKPAPPKFHLVTANTLAAAA